jgi:hypothetical protein
VTHRAPVQQLSHFLSSLTSPIDWNPNNRLNQSYTSDAFHIKRNCYLHALLLGYTFRLSPAVLLDSSRWPALIYLPVWYAYVFICFCVIVFSIYLHYGVNWSLFCMLKKCQHYHTCILLTTPFSLYAPFSRETLGNQVLTRGKFSLSGSIYKPPGHLHIVSIYIQQQVNSVKCVRYWSSSASSWPSSHFLVMFCSLWFQFTVSIWAHS